MGGITTNQIPYKLLYVTVENEGLNIVCVDTKAALDACISSDENIVSDNQDKKEIILYEVNKDLGLLFGVNRSDHKIFSHDFKFGRPVNVYGINFETIDIGSQQRRHGVRFFEPEEGGYGAKNQQSLSLEKAVQDIAERLGIQFKAKQTQRMG